MKEKKFQFTAPRRSWLWRIFLYFKIFKFQFTAPRRSWLNSAGKVRFTPKISIHSSTQELTNMTNYKLIVDNDFNSQLHAGADKKIRNTKTLLTISIHSSTQELTKIWKQKSWCRRFQFTAPRRSWRKVVMLGNNITNFNSQLHAGADIVDPKWILNGMISIHSSTQELTWLETTTAINGNLFQFTAPRRSWHVRKR